MKHIAKCLCRDTCIKLLLDTHIANIRGTFFFFPEEFYIFYRGQHRVPQKSVFLAINSTRSFKNPFATSSES